MSTQGPLYPGTVTTASVLPEDDNDWTTPGNVGADDGSEATITAATYDANDISFQLRARNLGFTIPAGSTINGITVEIQKRDQAIGAAVDYRVQLTDDAGTLVGDNKADTVTDWPTAETIITYGGATDTWNASPTSAMVNDPDFGVTLAVRATSANTDIFVDFIRVTIDYTEPVTRRAQVSWAELEVPTAPRRAQVSWAEFEIPSVPRRAQVSWAELEVPAADRRAQVSWSEFEVPDAPRRGQVSWAELEIPDVPTVDRRAQISWSEFEVPTAPRRAQVSWSEFEMPLSPRRAQLSWVEFEIPSVGGGGPSMFRQQQQNLWYRTYR